ncbi:hypothetical protein KY329_04605 [Candidatus Woesearchaeota archaeon]|nr:hypothetical protein [Candidatus Woesearchaeota archaeon]
MPNGKQIVTACVKLSSVPLAALTLTRCAENQVADVTESTAEKLQRQTREAAEAHSTQATEHSLEKDMTYIRRTIQDTLLQRDLADNQKGTWDNEAQIAIMEAYELHSEIKKQNLLERYSGDAGPMREIAEEFELNDRVLAAYMNQFAADNLGAVGAIDFKCDGDDNCQPDKIGFGGDEYDFGGLPWSTVSEALDLDLEPYQAVARAIIAYGINKANGSEQSHVAIQPNGEHRNVGTELWAVDEDGEKTPNYWMPVDRAMTNRGFIERDENGLVVRVYDVEGVWEEENTRSNEQVELTKGLLYLVRLGADDQATLTYTDADGNTKEATVYDLLDYPTENGHVEAAWVAPVLRNPEAANEYTNRELLNALERMYAPAASEASE